MTIVSEFAHGLRIVRFHSKTMHSLNDLSSLETQPTRSYASLRNEPTCLSAPCQSISAHSRRGGPHLRIITVRGTPGATRQVTRFTANWVERFQPAGLQPPRRLSRFSAQAARTD